MCVGICVCVYLLFSHSVVSDSLQSHGLQHARLPCPSPAPRVYSNSCSLSQWCHPSISFSVAPFFSCFQSFPASGLFYGLSSLQEVAKVLELQLQHQSFQWIFRTDFSLGLTDLISLQSKGFSRVFSSITSKASILQHSASFMVHLSHMHVTTGKTIALTRQTFVGKVMSLLFNTLAIWHSFSFKEQAYFNFMAAVTIFFGAQENKVCLCSHCFPIYLPWDQMPWSCFFKCCILSQIFPLSSFIFIKRLFSSSSLTAKRVMSSAYLKYWYFSQQSWFQLVLIQPSISHDVLCIS